VQFSVIARFVHTFEATVSLGVNQLCKLAADATALYQVAVWVVASCACSSNRAIDDDFTSGANLYAPCDAGDWLSMKFGNICNARLSRAGSSFRTGSFFSESNSGSSHGL